MNFVAQVEEHLRDLGAEARKKHPGVKEASERAILQLRSLQNAYVSAVRKASASSSSTTTTTNNSNSSNNKNSARLKKEEEEKQTFHHPTTALFQSQDLLRPFLLAANYPNASPHLLDISLKGMTLLLQNNAVCPGDGIHMVRVWTIQAKSCASSLSSNPPKLAAIPAAAAASTSWFGSLMMGATSSSLHSTTSSITSSVTSSSTTSINNNTLSTTSSSSSPIPSRDSHLNNHHHHIKRDVSEKLALDILRCLICLLEAKDLVTSEEQWTASVALCCILGNVRTVVVQQAAKATLNQVLNLLFQQGPELYSVETWKDLLALASQSSDHTFKGAFVQCKSSAPSPTLCLELLQKIAQGNPAWFSTHLLDVEVPSLETCHLLLSTHSTSFELVWRSYAVVYAIMTATIPNHIHTRPNNATTTANNNLHNNSNNNDSDNGPDAATEKTTANTTETVKSADECRKQVITEMVKGIIRATEACRNNDDFEDGFVYSLETTSGATSSTSSTNITANAIQQNPKGKTKQLFTLIPDSFLWRAGLALETIYLVLQKDPAVVVSVAESVSDFATVAASCRDHILQLVQCSKRNAKEDDLAKPIFPNLFRKAEEIQSAAAAALAGDRGNSISSSLPSTACDLGEALWTAFHCILELSRFVQEESSFAPCLAVLQHYLKRFPSSREVTRKSLLGYRRLAHIIEVEGSQLQRRALVSSLCKLSLPFWGKHDMHCMLEDHHVQSLVCLLKIVHRYHNHILSEWLIIFWTFEELASLSVASVRLSDNGYTNALHIAQVYPRLAPFTTCLSLESLSEAIQALTQVSLASLQKREGNATASNNTGDLDLEPTFDESTTTTSTATREANKSGHSKPESNNPIIGKESLSGKIMSFAGKALLGSDKSNHSNNHHDQPDHDSYQPLRAQRTKKMYLADFKTEFVQRMTSFRRSGGFRGNVVTNLPCSLMLLTDVALANTFRYKKYGKTISNQLYRLSSSCEQEAIREYAMDMLNLLVTSQLASETTLVPAPVVVSEPSRLCMLDPSNDQLLAIEAANVETYQVVDDAGDAHHIDDSQEYLLSPLCEKIRLEKQADVAESSMNALHSMLEGSGHNLSGSAWAVVIDAISSLSGNYVASSSSDHAAIDRTGSDWSPCCMLAFKCLKLIVDNFLSELPPHETAPREALLECCSSFGSSRHDVNTSLTAIGLLWTIADQDGEKNTIDCALSKLVFLSADQRPEVRNCSVNTLFSCIVGQGQHFTDMQWQTCISHTVFDVYQQVLSRGITKSNNVESEAETAAAATTTTTTSKYKVSVHHSRDSADKQWAGTEVLVIRGLSRVLRSYFSRLLQTTNSVRVSVGESPSKSTNSWFIDAWDKILELALRAAKQKGGRDTLDLRSAAIDVLVLCCQLSCRAGIQATPAKVGTNMEVVNGALRSVDEEPTLNKQQQQQANTTPDISSKNRKEVLFMMAFDKLGEFQIFLEETTEEKDDLSAKSIYLEPVLVQVLFKLITELQKLYECCKDEEFFPSKDNVILSEVREEEEGHEKSATAKGDDLEARFVDLVGTVAVKAVGDQGAKFLTQAQRAAFDLLRGMVTGSSNQALRVLASLAGPAFFWIVSKDNGTEVDDEAETGNEVLGKEAASVVSEEITNDSLSDSVKAQVLCQLLSVFIEESDKESWNMSSTQEKEQYRKRSYRLFVRVMETGLASASQLAAKPNGEAGLLDLLWERVELVLSRMLAPIHIPDTPPYISQASHLSHMIKSAVQHAPKVRHDEVCSLLSSGAFRSIDIAKKHTLLVADEDAPAEKRKRFKKRHDEALKLCRECAAGLCALQPNSQILYSITEQSFSDVIKFMGENQQPGGKQESVEIEIALIFCDVIKKTRNIESLVVTLFPQLCLLVSVNHFALRTEIASLMEIINVGEALAEATRRAKEAEDRAERAERENELLLDEIEELQEENDRLQRDIAVLSASSALT